MAYPIDDRYALYILHGALNFYQNWQDHWRPTRTAAERL